MQHKLAAELGQRVFGIAHQEPAVVEGCFG